MEEEDVLRKRTPYVLVGRELSAEEEGIAREEEEEGVGGGRGGR